MKRAGLLVLWSTVIGLAACQGKSPTTPSEVKGTPNLATGASASEMRPYDDDDDHDGSTLSVRMTASPTTIQPGGSSTLTWTSTGATWVELEDERVAANGSKVVSPSQSKEYEIKAGNGLRTVEAEVRVSVSSTAPPPTPTPKPTATLTANPASIQSGQSSMLTWSTADATSVTLNGASVAASGSQSVSPTANATYSLVATNSAGSTTATATVTVAPTPPPTPKPTASLNANPASIQSGQSSMLSWTTTDAATVTLNGASVAANGSQSVSPTSNATYSLVATNSAGSTTATANVTVTAPTPMPTATLTANPASIQSGQSSMLSWSTTDAATVTLNGATVAGSGSQSVSPTSTATYSLVATNSSGSRTATATVTVTAPPPPMPTAMLSANPTSIQSGQSATLSWTTSNAASVTLNGAGVAANGSQMVSPASTTTYSLVATNATGSVTRTAMVTVVAPTPRLTYVNDIAPIMQSNCVMCHSGPQPTAGRDFSTYMGVMTVVTPFDPNSRLIQMTKPGAPMHGFLNPDPAGRAEIIRQWIVNDGAPQQ